MPKTTLATLRCRAEKARVIGVTCGASRHLHIMADELAKGREYLMFKEEPDHCAESIYAVLAELWELRSKHPRAKISRKK